MCATACGSFIYRFVICRNRVSIVFALKITNERHYDSAIELLNIAIKENPTFAQSYDLLGFSKYFQARSYVGGLVLWSMGDVACSADVDCAVGMLWAAGFWRGLGVVEMAMFLERASMADHPVCNHPSQIANVPRGQSTAYRLEERI